MEDRFKFRVWDVENKKYIDPGKGFISGSGKFFYKCDDDQLYNWTEDFIIEQCIGHKDKAGKLIYAGDLVDDGHCLWPCEIVWNHSAWGFKSRGCFLYPLHEIETYEIVGNIHENPELLNNPLLNLNP